MSHVELYSDKESLKSWNQKILIEKILFLYNYYLKNHEITTDKTCKKR